MLIGDADASERLSALPTTGPGGFWSGADDRLSFRRVVPHTEDIERLVDAHAVIQQASLLGQAALGERAGKGARRVQVLGGTELALPPRCASFAGYSLHAGVGFKASDRAGLERLCRYILRPPPEPPETAKARRAKRLTRHPRMRLTGERPSWSDLLERVFRMDGFASSTGSAARPARLGSTSRATTGGREHAGPGAEPCPRRGEGPSSGAVHRVAALRREGQRG